MYLWIPMFVISLILTGSYISGKKIRTYYRDLEVVKGNGLIVRYAQDTNRPKYYIQFTQNGKTYESKASGSYCLSRKYQVGQHVPIRYHIHENGQATIYIDDENYDEIKNHSGEKFSLYGAIGCFVLAVISFIWYLLEH